MIKIKINTAKVTRDRLYKGSKGTYLNCTLVENRDGRDEYGNDGFIAEECTKSERAADPNIRGEIIGNWYRLESKQSESPAPAPVAAPAPAPAKAESVHGNDDIPWD